MKILVVEDEILIQKSLVKLLQKRGIDAIGVAQGQDAIELIIEHEFDRIVCDLMLKDISGFNVIEESKKKYSIEEIAKKFVIITAYSSEQVHEKAKKYNCKVLSKPFANLNDAIDIFINQE